MSTSYDRMHHNYTKKIKEPGVSTTLLPIGSDSDSGPEAYALRYHNTNVVTAHPNGTVILKSGGWMTVTTKERINRYLPAGQLYQKNHEWFISMPNGNQVPFEDGMVAPVTDAQFEEAQKR